MPDFRPLLKENSEIHDGSKFNGGVRPNGAHQFVFIYDCPGARHQVSVVRLGRKRQRRSAHLKQEPLVAVQLELSELVNRHRVDTKALFISDQNRNACLP
jgi:hypothetical protein